MWSLNEGEGCIEMEIPSMAAIKPNITASSWPVDAWI